MEYKLWCFTPRTKSQTQTKTGSSTGKYSGRQSLPVTRVCYQTQKQTHVSPDSSQQPHSVFSEIPGLMCFYTRQIFIHPSWLHLFVILHLMKYVSSVDVYVSVLRHEACESHTEWLLWRYPKRRAFCIWNKGSNWSMFVLSGYKASQLMFRQRKIFLSCREQDWRQAEHFRCGTQRKT